MSLNEQVPKGRGNAVSIFFFEDGEPMTFTGVDRMLMSFEDQTVVADTDVDASLIDFSQGELDVEKLGLIVFKLGTLDITSRDYLPVTLVAFDPSHPEGQDIIRMKNRKLQFLFCEV